MRGKVKFPNMSILPGLRTFKQIIPSLYGIIELKGSFTLNVLKTVRFH